MDENDYIVGIKGDVIHTYNKNETAIKHTEYYDMVQQRSNVILMGDNIGDAGMAEGMEHCDVVVKVGFLGNNAEGNLKNYLNKFDIVLVNEPSVDVVNAILQFLLWFYIVIVAKDTYTRSLNELAVGYLILLIICSEIGCE